MKSWPLRVKLVVLMLVLLAAALATTGIATVISTRDYLIDRVDAQLLDSVAKETQSCGRPGDPHGFFGAPVQRNGYFVSCGKKDGTFAENTYNPIDTDQSRPAILSSWEAVGGLTQLSDTTEGTYATVDPLSGTGRSWRVLYARQFAGLPPGAEPRPVAIAISLDDVDNSVSRQIVMSATIGGFVLLVLAVVAYLLVRSSLRPLIEVEETAEAIAAGDLSRRVPEADPRTEVGGLAQALNTMLGQIETAFEERSASERAALASEQAALASEQSAVASENRMRRFVADASHELRTPLTSIRGFAELHRQSGHSDDAIARIEHHATRMGLLVDDLLLLARMDQQRPLEKKPVDLLALATDALIDARVTAGDHRLRLRTPNSDDDEADTEAPIVLGDEARLRQVLQNLLSNAKNHTPPGTEVTVFVGTESGRAILEVADNGPGMTEHDAARVFERFYRTDPSRTRALGGSGLGLSIVAALVAAHNGKVTLQTSPGEGATFRVEIPLLHPTP